MVLGHPDSYIQVNETRSPTYTIHKNKFKMDKSRDTIKVLEKNIGRKTSDIPCKLSEIIIIQCTVVNWEY